jgi:hypothetical protein
MIKKKNHGGGLTVEVHRKDEVQKEKPDMLDELILKALGTMVITRTPYGYKVTAPRERAWKSKN